MQGLLRTCYEGAPLPLKRIVCLLPYKWLAGGSYRETLHVCRRLDRMSRSEIVRLQENKLGDLLRFAVEDVPFYESLRDAVHRLTPFDALQEFPLLSKRDVQQQSDNLIPRSIARIPHRKRSTGGTSGNQLHFLEDTATYATEMGFMHSQWARVGYTPRSRKATFRGVAFHNITEKCFWQENPIHNELQFSPFHMSEKNLGLYVERLAEYRPNYLHGYPSALDVLAEYVLRYRLTTRLPRLAAALLASEGCSLEQRERIEKAFNTRIYTFYGHSERTVLGGECECSEYYHAFPAYGVLEIVREDGASCDVGERGEIVGTGFLNRSMPLIRYRTDDYATRESPECACGRAWDRFSHVEGRWSLEQFVFGKNGAKISAAALNMHADVYANVVRYQYYQRTAGQLIIRVVPSPTYSFRDDDRIMAAHEQKLWGEMDIMVQRVQDIPLTSSGKQRRIVCESEVFAACERV